MYYIYFENCGDNGEFHYRKPAPVALLLSEMKNKTKVTKRFDQFLYVAEIVRNDNSYYIDFKPANNNFVLIIKVKTDVHQKSIRM